MAANNCFVCELSVLLMHDHHLEIFGLIDYCVEALTFSQNLLRKMAHLHQLTVFLLSRVEDRFHLNNTIQRITHLDIRFSVVKSLDVDFALILQDRDILLNAHHILIQNTDMYWPCSLVIKVDTGRYRNNLKYLIFIRSYFHLKLHIFTQSYVTEFCLLAVYGLKND